MLKHVTGFPSFFKLDNIPLCVYTIICLSFYPWLGILVDSTACILWIVLLWTQVCVYRFDTLLAILLVIYPELGLLGYMIFLLFYIFRNLHTVFHGGCTIFHSHQQCTTFPPFSYPHQHLFPVTFFYNSHSNGVRW